MALWLWCLFAAGALALPQWGAGSFLLNRLEHTGKVMDARLVHWQRALSLQGNTAEQIWGVGLGRFPSRYDQADRVAGFPGQIRWHAKTSNPDPDLNPTPTPSPNTQSGRDFVKLWATHGRTGTAGSYGLTQRVPILPGVRYQVELDLRASTPTVVVAEVCERHLLYDWDCQYTVFRPPVGRSDWSRQTQTMKGPVFQSQPWYAPRLGMLMLTVLNAGGEADVGHVALKAGDSAGLIENGDFRAQLARWFPAAQYHYLPWHADSLALELLVERGWSGLIAFGALMALALTRLARSSSADMPITRYLAASLLGLLLAGVFGSVMDMPRIAFLVYFLALFALELPVNREKLPPRPNA